MILQKKIDIYIKQLLVSLAINTKLHTQIKVHQLSVHLLYPGHKFCEEISQRHQDQY